jgi:hypothetical protein
MDSTKVKPSISQQNVTIKEIEDEDIQRMNVKEKSRSESLLEEDNDDKLIFNHRSISVPPKVRVRTTLTEVPETYNNEYQWPTNPNVFKYYVLTLHSDTYKYKGLQLKKKYFSQLWMPIQMT